MFSRALNNLDAETFMGAVNRGSLLDDLCLASAVSSHEQVLVADTLDQMAPITSRLITYTIQSNAPWYRMGLKLRQDDLRS